MKNLMALITSLIVISGSSKALACAGCLDVYPEIIVLNSATNAEILKSQAAMVAKGDSIRLSDISCTKPNGFMSPDKVKCTFDGVYNSDVSSVKVEIEGIAAEALLSQLLGVTAEVAVLSEEGDSDQRTGERIKASLVSRSLKETTVSVPSINVGNLSCHLLKGKQRCEVELNVLNVSYIYAQ